MTRLVVKNDKMTLALGQSEAKSYMSKAKAKSERYTKISPDHKSPYGFNHPHSHFVGMIAEHSAWVLFDEIQHILRRDLKIDPAFQDDTRDAECDLIVNNLRIEVKGIQQRSWNRFGPCISTRQLRNIQRKADVVLWVLYDEHHQAVSFEGFNYVKDITSVPTKFTAGKGKEPIENYPVLDIIKPLQELPL